jgi:drug/metabolite transporter (DMT)-like permease
MKSPDADLVSFAQGAVISASGVGILGAVFSGLRAFREDIPIFGIMMLVLSALAVSIYSALAIVERSLRSARHPVSSRTVFWFALGICPFAVVLSKTMKVYLLDPFEIYIVGIIAYVFAARYVSKRKGA